MNTFADVVVARAGDQAVGVVSGDQRLTWAEVVREATRSCPRCGPLDARFM